MKIKMILLVASVALLLMNCELVVDVKLPEVKPSLVVNGIMNNDSLLTVSVTQSRHVLDNQPFFTAVENADIKVTDESGVQHTLVHQSGEWYRASFRPAMGVLYTLTVSAPNFEPVVASARMPKAVVIESAKIDSSQLVNGAVNPKIPVEVTFQDLSTEENFYEIRIVQRVAIRYPTPDGQLRDDTIFTVRPLLFPGSNQEERSSIFDDILFNGRTFTFASEVGYYYGNPGGTVLETQIELISISAEYYLYLTTRNLQQRSDGDPFAQPVLVFNNIENGMGIFGGFHSAVWRFGK